MCQLPPSVFAAFVLAASLLGSGTPVRCLAQENSTRPNVGDKTSSIPAPRAEPVVPASPAKSIASQLNDAYVSVFEHVAPTVVVIAVLKRSTADGESEYFPDLFFRTPPVPKSSGDKEKDRERDKNIKEGKEKATKPEEPPAPARRVLSSSEGSGFVIQSGGLILTNNHVVGGAEKISVRLKDGRQFQGRLVGADEKTDIAVVKIDAADLPTAELANSDNLRVGQIACAIGVPFKQAYSFTAGVVSAKNRNGLLSEDNYNYEDYVQTDASINPGNSGGPLVDLDGKVIGMNTLINGQNRGLGFAIPSNMLREVGDQLIRSGRVVRSYLGVRIQSLNSAVEQYGNVFSGVKRGVVVMTIEPGSPALDSKLRPTDVITEVDGIGVGTDKELQKQILAKRIGVPVQLTVVRKNKTIKVEVLTAELPQEPKRLFGGGSDAEPGEMDEPPAGAAPTPTPPLPKADESGPLFGLQLQDLTKDVANSLNLGAGASGVLVTAVQSDSVAERAGLTIKDVITSVDDRLVRDTASFKEALKSGDPRRGILCYVDRAGAKAFVVLKTE